VVARQDDLELAVAVDVRDDGWRVCELRAIAVAPALPRQRDVVVGLHRGHHAVTEAGVGEEGSPVAVEDAEADRVVGGDDVEDAVTVQVTRADVLVIAAVVPATFCRHRRVAARAHLRPPGVEAPVGPVDGRRRPRARLVDQDLDDAVAVDVGGRDRPDLAVAEAARPAWFELALPVVERQVGARVAVDAAGHPDLHVAVAVEIPHHRGRPHARPAVVEVLQGTVREGRLPQERPVDTPDVEDRVPGRHDLERAVAVHVVDGRRGEPVLVPARREGRAQRRHLYRAARAARGRAAGLGRGKGGIARMALDPRRRRSAAAEGARERKVHEDAVHERMVSAANASG
jgi:hypothetical protein